MVTTAEPAAGSARYDAFLSYSHEDAAIASALQRGLHRVGRPLGRLRALRIYRDATDLAANPGFWAELERAMDDARWLVALASPAAAGSEWVARELRRWIDTRGGDHVLLVLARGTLKWDPTDRRFDPDRSDALVPVLAEPGVFDDEPLYVDLTSLSPDEIGDLRAPAFRARVVDLAAPIHGKPKDQLDSEDRRELRRFRRYRRIAVALLAVLTIAASVAAVVAVGQRNTAREREAEARAGELAALSVAAEDPFLAMALAVESEMRTPEPSPQARSAYAAALQRWGALPATPAGAAIDAHVGDVGAISWSPDGRLLATAGSDGWIRIWSTERRALAYELGGSPAYSPVTDVDWAPSGAMLAASHTDGSVRLWDTSEWNVVLDVGRHDAPVHAVRFTPDGAHLASADADGVVLVSSVADGSVVHDLTPDAVLDGERPAEGSFRGSVSWSPDGTQLATSSGTSGSPLVWTLDRSAAPVPLAAHDDEVRHVAWSPDGTAVASAGADGAVLVSDPATGDFLFAAEYAGDFVNAVAWSPDGATMAIGGHDATVRFFSAETGIPIGAPLTAHDDFVQAVAWSPDGLILASGADGGRIHIWEASPDRIEPGRSLGGDFAHDVAWSVSGQILAAAVDSDIILLDSSTGQQLARVTAPGEVFRLEWSPDDRLLAAVHVDGQLRIWRLHEGGLTLMPGADDGADTAAVAWSMLDDEAWLFQASFAGTVVRRSMATGAIEPVVTVESATSLAASTDGSRLVIGSSGGLVFLWTAGDEEPRRFELPAPEVQAVALTDDGDRLAAATDTGVVFLIHVGDGRTVPLLGHNGAVNDVGFDRLGEVLASVADDATTRLWDGHSGRVLGTPLRDPLFNTDVTGLAWSPDGRTLVSAGGFGMTWWWGAVDEPAACRAVLAAVGGAAVRALFGDGSEPQCLDPDNVPALTPLPVTPAACVRAGSGSANCPAATT